MVWCAMAIAACGEQTSGSGTGAQGGAGGSGGAQGGTAMGGSGGDQGGAPQGGAAGGSPGVECAQCAVPPAGSQCASYETDCTGDEGGCKVWRLCVTECLNNDFTADCFDACKAASAASEPLFSAVLGCICNACPAVCSPMCG